MPKTLNFTDSDLQLDSVGNLSAITGIESLRQNVEQSLQYFKVEWFLNKLTGVPYFQGVLVKPADAGLVASIFNSVILSKQEVTGLGDVQAALDPTTRVFTYRAQVETVFGQMEVDL